MDCKLRATEDHILCWISHHGRFDAWIRAVDSYAGDDLLYLNRDGIIPLAAVIKKGERRENPFREKKIFDATSFPAAEEVKKQLEEQGEAEDEDFVVDKQQLAEMEG